MLDKRGLLADVARLPIQPDAAMRLLGLLDDPDASAGAVAAVIESDPALSLQVIRMANTPYYGLSTQVANARHAVTVLGFGLVRTIAASKVFKLSATRHQQIPDGFWSHSLTAGAAASVLARRVGVPPNDALSAALLLDLGIALLHRRFPDRYAAVWDEATRRRMPLVLAEQQELGVDHAEISGYALEKLRFPPALTGAVAQHHTLPARPGAGLASVLVAAEAIAHEVDDPLPEPGVAPEVALEAAGLAPGALEDLVEAVRHEREALAGFQPVVA
ncbi:MAG: HDOD domain-containing protein [Acidimicrobiia bacterium]|nr:HDOD domain-containing protein [Acidimicrobiia bacterium]